MRVEAPRGSPRPILGREPVDVRFRIEHCSPPGSQVLLESYSRAEIGVLGANPYAWR